MFRTSSASVPATDLNGNPVIFQKVEMNPNQQWMPIGNSLSNIKTLLAVSEESYASCSAIDSINHILCPVTADLDMLEYRTKAIPFPNAILIETPNTMESTTKQNTLYISQQVPSSDENGAIMYLQPAPNLEVSALSDTILYTDPLPQCTNAGSIVSNEVGEGPIFQINLPDKMKTYTCDTHLSMVHSGSSEPVTTIYDITIPFNNKVEESTDTDSITKFTSHLTNSCHTAIQAIDRDAYEMASGEPSSFDSLTNDFQSRMTNSCYKAVNGTDPARIHQMDSSAPTSYDFVTRDLQSHLATTCQSAVHVIDPVIKCELVSRQPHAHGSVRSGLMTRGGVSSVQSQTSESDAEPCLVTYHNYEWWVDTWLEQIRIAVCSTSSERSDIDADVISVGSCVEADEVNAAAIQRKPLERTKQDIDEQDVDGHLTNITMKRSDVLLGNPAHPTAIRAQGDVKPGCSDEHINTSFETSDDKSLANLPPQKQQQSHAEICSHTGSELFLSTDNKRCDMHTYRHRQQQGHIKMCGFSRNGLFASSGKKKAKISKCTRRRKINELFVREETPPNKMLKCDISKSIKI